MRVLYISNNSHPMSSVCRMVPVACETQYTHLYNYILFIMWFEYVAVVTFWNAIFDTLVDW